MEYTCISSILIYLPFILPSVTSEERSLPVRNVRVIFSFVDHVKYIKGKCKPSTVGQSCSLLDMARGITSRGKTCRSTEQVREGAT